MKKQLTFILFLLLATVQVFSQVSWYRDFESAQEASLREGKLILIDFWAIWCGPCKQMDSRLWSSEEFKEINQNIIPLKVDIDIDRNMAMRYNIKSIPKVVLVNVTGEILYEETGFSSENSYLKILSKIPKDVMELNKSLQPILEKEKGDEVYFNIALAYQELGRTNENSRLEDAFFDKSTLYFKKVKGHDDKSNLLLKSELEIILTEAYRGKTKQVAKKLTKLDTSFTDPELVELLNFIEAYCCKLDGDNENFLIKKKLIENENYLSQLDG